jgi:VWFA-related protein
MKAASLFLILLLLSSAVVAETVTAPIPYIETFEVRLHNLDVVVTDAKGKPVHGLTSADFVVVDNGAPQPITNFSIYDASAASATGVTEKSGETNLETETMVSTPPARRIVFFIDELSIQRIARNRLYASVKTFVDAMRPGDVAAIVRPTSKEKITQEFTGDRAAIERILKEAIDQSDVQPIGSRQEVAALRWALKNAITANDIREAKREYGDAAARRVEHRLGQIRALTTSLAGIEGKKIVVLVTMGLSAQPGIEAWDFAERLGAIMQTPGIQEMGMLEGDNVQVPEAMAPADDPTRTHLPSVHDLTKAIQEIARSAAANGVTIYALEPDVPLDLLIRGNAAIPGKMGKDQHVHADPAMELASAFHGDLLQNGETTLASLTETTGGRWFRGISHIDDTFRQVSEDVSFYYSLAYRAKGEADTPRRVKVTIRNRPELRVRTRTEVLEKSTGREMSDLVVASLLYPRPVNELGIQVTPGTPEKVRGFYTIPLDVVVPMTSLTFLPAANGNYVASFDLHYAAAGEQRDFGAGGKRQQTIEISPEQHAHLTGVNYRYKTGIQVSPGRARIAIGLLDTATKLTGFQTVEVVTQ